MLITQLKRGTHLNEERKMVLGHLTIHVEKKKQNYSITVSIETYIRIVDIYII